MSAIQQQNNVADSGVYLYGIFDLPKWEDFKETATVIAVLAAAVILPVASYWASGTIACVAVVSLEIVCWSMYQALAGVAAATTVAAGVLGPVVDIAGQVVQDGRIPVASWR